MVEIENNEEELDYSDAGGLDIDDDFLETFDILETEENNEEESEEDSDKSNKEEGEEDIEENEENEEENEEEEEYLSDEEIKEKYGENADPALIRHYDVTKDYLLLDDDFEFTGDNISEAYEQDEKNRTEAVKEKIIEWLPEKAKVLLSEIIENSGEVSNDTLTMILENRITESLNSYDPTDEESIKNYIRKDLIEKGQGDEAEDIIDLYEERGKLESVAQDIEKKNRDKLAELEKKRIDEERENERIQRENEVQRYNQVKDILSKSNYSKNLSDKILNTLYGKAPDGGSNLIHKLKQIYTDSNALVVLADLVSNYDSNNKTWNLEKFEEKIESKTTNKFKSSIEKKISGNNASKLKSKKIANKKSISWDDVDL